MSKSPKNSCSSSTKEEKAGCQTKDGKTSCNSKMKEDKSACSTSTKENK